MTLGVDVIIKCDRETWSFASLNMSLTLTIHLVDTNTKRVLLCANYGIPTNQVFLFSQGRCTRISFSCVAEIVSSHEWPQYSFVWLIRQLSPLIALRWTYRSLKVSECFIHGKAMKSFHVNNVRSAVCLAYHYRFWKENACQLRIFGTSFLRYSYRLDRAKINIINWMRWVGGP